jgi:hypothetical protein
MEEKDLYLEYKILPQFWGWVLLILFAASILGYGMLSHMILPDTPREWDFGQFPDAPAESVYSTVEPVRGAAYPNVIKTLPEARPLEEEQEIPESRMEKGTAPMQEHEPKTEIQ